MRAIYEMQRLVAGWLALVALCVGCQRSTMSLDPFLGPQRIPPPGTGSAVPQGTAPYYPPAGAAPAYPSTTPSYPPTTAPAGSPAAASPYAPPGGFGYPQTSSPLSSTQPSSASGVQQASWVQPTALQQSASGATAGRNVSPTSSSATSASSSSRSGTTSNAPAETPIRIVESGSPKGSTSGYRRTTEAASPAPSMAAAAAAVTSGEVIDITKLPDAR